MRLPAACISHWHQGEARALGARLATDSDLPAHLVNYLRGSEGGSRLGANARATLAKTCVHPESIHHRPRLAPLAETPPVARTRPQSRRNQNLRHWAGMSRRVA